VEHLRPRYSGIKRNLEGRETDDEAMFEKRYEYMQENEDIVREYRERGS
jgi:hypothetical protein